MLKVNTNINFNIEDLEVPKFGHGGYNKRAKNILGGVGTIHIQRTQRALFFSII